MKRLALALAVLGVAVFGVRAFTSSAPPDWRLVWHDEFDGQWGQPFLIGPGSIHVAHTLEERVPKNELIEAIEIYSEMVKELCKRASK